MPINLAALKTEIALPAYTGKGDEQCADLLNAPGVPVDRETLDAGLLIASIVRTEYDALTAPAKEYVRLIAMAQSLPLTATLKQQLGQIFPNPSATRTNLVALLKRTGSRAEELNLGGRVSTSDVADARRLP